jgi:hypothetical protein
MFEVPLSQIPEIRLAQIPNPLDFGFGVPLSQIPETRLAQIPNPLDFGFGVPLSQIPETRLAQIPNSLDFGFGVREYIESKEQKEYSNEIKNKLLLYVDNDVRGIIMAYCMSKHTIIVYNVILKNMQYHAEPLKIKYVQTNNLCVCFRSDIAHHLVSMQLTINENIGIHKNKYKNNSLTDTLKRKSQNYDSIYDFYGNLILQNVEPERGHLINLYDRLRNGRHTVKIEMKTKNNCIYQLYEIHKKCGNYSIILDQFEHMNIKNDLDNINNVYNIKVTAIPVIDLNAPF